MCKSIASALHADRCRCKAKHLAVPAEDATTPVPNPRRAVGHVVKGDDTYGEKERERERSSQGPGHGQSLHCLSWALRSEKRERKREYTDNMAWPGV